MKINLIKIFLLLFCALSVNAQAQYFEYRTELDLLISVTVENIFKKVTDKDKILLSKNNIAAVVIKKENVKCSEAFFNFDGTLDSLLLYENKSADIFKFFYKEGEVSRTVTYEYFPLDVANPEELMLGTVTVDYYRINGRLDHIFTATDYNHLRSGTYLRFYLEYDSKDRIIKSSVKNLAFKNPQFSYTNFEYNEDGYIKRTSEKDYTYNFGKYPVLTLPAKSNTRSDEYTLTDDRIKEIQKTEWHTGEFISTKYYYYKGNGLVDFTEEIDKDGNKIVQNYEYIYR